MGKSLRGFRGFRLRRLVLRAMGKMNLGRRRRQWPRTRKARKTRISKPTAMRRKLRQGRKITYGMTILAGEIEPNCESGLVKGDGTDSVGRVHAEGGIEPQWARRAQRKERNGEGP